MKKEGNKLPETTKGQSEIKVEGPVSEKDEVKNAERKMRDTAKKITGK